MVLSMMVQVPVGGARAYSEGIRVFTRARSRQGLLLAGVDFLAMLYLIVFLIAALSASFIIDTSGLQVNLGIGAALAGAAGLLEEI